MLARVDEFQAIVAMVSAMLELCRKPNSFELSGDLFETFFPTLFAVARQARGLDQQGGAGAEAELRPLAGGL